MVLNLYIQTNITHNTIYKSSGYWFWLFN